MSMSAVWLLLLLVLQAYFTCYDLTTLEWIKGGRSLPKWRFRQFQLPLAYARELWANARLTRASAKSAPAKVGSDPSETQSVDEEEGGLSSSSERQAPEPRRRFTSLASMALSAPGSSGNFQGLGPSSPEAADALRADVLRFASDRGMPNLPASPSNHHPRSPVVPRRRVLRRWNTSDGSTNRPGTSSQPATGWRWRSGLGLRRKISIAFLDATEAIVSHGVDVSPHGSHHDDSYELDMEIVHTCPATAKNSDEECAGADCTNGHEAAFYSRARPGDVMLSPSMAQEHVYFGGREPSV